MAVMLRMLTIRTAFGFSLSGRQQLREYVSAGSLLTNAQRAEQDGWLPITATVTGSSSSEGRNRRYFFQSSVSSLLLSFLPKPAAAKGGLVQFPCVKPLANTYHFLRVGETLLEAADVWCTNPLFLTNQEAGLSEHGKDQIQQVCQQLSSQDIPTVARYSFAAACLDTAAIVGDQLQITQERLVPEFFFLDPRAIGQWDKQPLSTTEPAVWALDVDQAQYDGRGGRPPANDDSTPHETLGDHAIRLRQLFSACETFYSGDTVLLIFPDGTGPALLSCMMAGIPFNRVHELEYAPGELRRNITRTTSLQLLAGRQASAEWQQAYLAKLEQGRQELKRLQAIDFVQEQNNALTTNAQSKATTAAQLKQSKNENISKRSSAQPQSTDSLAASKTDGDSATTSGSSTSSALAATSKNDSMLTTLVGSAGILGIAVALLASTGVQDDRTTNATFDDSTEDPGVIDGISTRQSAASLGNGDRVDSKPSQAKTPARNESIDASPGRSEVFDNSYQAGEAVKGLSTSTKAFTAVSPSFAKDAASPPREKGARVAAAQEAMQEYLNADDGGTAWLQSLSDILADDGGDDAGAKEDNQQNRGKDD